MGGLPTDPNPGPYAFEGLQVLNTTSYPLRQECTAWATSNNDLNQIQKSLFIRALQSFYNIPYNWRDSYYGLAGIHGYPHDVEWNQGGKPANVWDSQNNFKVYCTHGMITFPTWHRPYMLLFEKRIQELMLDCINKQLKFSTVTKNNDKQAWIDATTQWRLPYWDWGVSNVKVPNIYRTPQISIRKPKDDSGNVSTESVDNPLNRYALKYSNQGNDVTFGALQSPNNLAVNPWNGTSATSRHIRNTDSSADIKAGVNHPEDVDSAISQGSPASNLDTQGKPIALHQISDLVYRMFSPQYIKTWQLFATTSTTAADKKAENWTNWQSWLSLEQIHNIMHGMIGGSGQMSNPTVAAFDPIFYMHHCNIDRQFALWQILNPDLWFNDSSDKPKSTDGLPPFYRSTDKTYWTSNDVRNWKKLGYQYDQLDLHDKETNSARIARLAQWIKTTYPSTGPVVTAPGSRQFLGPEPVAPDAMTQDEPVAFLLADTGEEDDLVDGDPTLPILTPDAGVGEAPETQTSGRMAQQPMDVKPAQAQPAHRRKKHRRYPDYLINVLYDRYALDGSPYFIHFFLGDIPDDEVRAKPVHIVSDPRQVGSIYTFSEKILDHCANCSGQARAGILSTASLPITIPLMHRAKDTSDTDIQDIYPDNVARYLQRHLYWKAVTPGGEVITMDRLPRTRVFVLKGIARHFDDDQSLSEYGYYRPMPRVTEGKAAGATEAQYDDPESGLHD